MRGSAGTIEECRSATRRLIRNLDGLTDEAAHAPSRLPGWNRAEVITHLARNADGTRHMVEAAARGEAVAQYPGGISGRAAEIARGRDDRAADLLHDLRRACDRMLDAFLALPSDAWDRIGYAISGERTMREALWSRVREVEIHHVDLDIGYEPGDWPVAFAARVLDEAIATLPARASAARPLVDEVFRVVSTDHGEAWCVELSGRRVTVRSEPVGDERAEVAGEVSGWGCDLVAWFYGRDPRSGGVLGSGDLSVLRLPKWFPYG